MTCLRGRRIRNPKKKPTGLDKPFITIPDGRCAECRKRKTNDYLVRSYFEYISRPYDVFAVCLDFDDEHLPTYEGVPCFDYELVKVFLAKLRYEYIDFRFLCVPHLGDAFDRPHYHLVFYFNKEDNANFYEFAKVLHKCWKHGSYSNIQELSSDKTPFGVISYVCSYAVQGENYFRVKKDLHDKMVKLPYRYRPHIHSSIGYGCQCLDPHEFNCKRLIKEGVKFLDTPVITKDYMRNNHVVYIVKDPRQPEIKIPFSIPRFYELKLFFHSSWDYEEKKQSLVRTQEGIELSKIRHNVHYKHYYNEFVNSAYDHLMFTPYERWLFSRVPGWHDSPYLGMSWQDIVSDVLTDKEKFLEFCRVRDFIETWDYKDFRRLIKSAPRSFSVQDWTWFQILPRSYWSAIGQFQYYIGRSMEVTGFYTFLSDIDLYVQAAFIFDLCKQNRSNRIAVYKDFLMDESRKAKIRNRCAKRPDYLAWLKRKGFDFNKIKPYCFTP